MPGIIICDNIPSLNDGPFLIIIDILTVLSIQLLEPGSLTSMVLSALLVYKNHDLIFNLLSYVIIADDVLDYQIYLEPVKFS